MSGKNTASQLPAGLENWAQYLAEKSLPLLDNTTRYVAQLNESSGASLDRICAGLLLDPGAVVALLQKVNSVKRGRLSSEITTVENAVMLMGISKAKKVLEKCKVVKMPVRAPALKHYLKQVDLAYHAGYMAYEWATIRGNMVAKESFVSAFLFHIGEMYMWLYGASEILKVRDAAVKRKVSFRVAQQDMMGFDFRHLSERLTHILNMPEFVQDCFNEKYFNNPRVKGIHLSSAWVSIANHSGLYNQTIRTCEEEIAELIGWHLPDTTSMLHNNLVSIARETDLYGVLPLARELPRTDVEGEATDEPALTDISREKPSESTSPDNKSRSIASTPDPDRDEISHKTPKQILHELVVLLTGEEGKKLPHQKLVSTFLSGLQAALKLDHVMYCETGAKGKNLKAIQFSDKQTRRRLEKFFVDLTHENLFKKLLKKSQSLWMSEKNNDKLWPFVPVVVKGLINTKHFYVMTLVLDNGIHGMVYADRASSGVDLDEDTYNMFKKLCHLFGKTLEQLDH